MGTISPASPDRMYPWWWDSHINPKNSKWLHENVTDMDTKVKQMIKLIEEDADSFARRAEMYYKKRPELMKLVEEFYRAYRALAGRYDHVAGVLRQAHRAVAEVFPNQVPFSLVDELPAGLGNEAYPGSPHTSQIFLPFDLGEWGKDALQISNDLTGSGEGPKLAKSAERRARKSLNFRDAETIQKGEEKIAADNNEAQVQSESERMGKAELEILTLKTVLSSLEAEKQAGLLQYQQSLERLSNLEMEVSRAKEDSNGLNERASKAEAEVNTLKESLEKLDAERHSSFLQYQLCVEKISKFENYISRAETDAGQLNERASKAETEAQTLSHDLTKLEDEKESSLVLYNQCLEKIYDMEGKLLQAKEAARRSNDRADTADKEVEALMQALATLVDEKEGAAIKYNNCLETIALLEHKLKVAEEDAKRLNSKIDDGVAKFKSAEERCLQLERSNQMLHSDMETSAQKMAAQNEELIEKQKELSRIWTCLQEERFRFVETQNALQSLERSNSRSQEELMSSAVEIRKLEASNKSLLSELEQIKVENKGLNEVNLSLALTVKDLKAEVSCSRETIGKLEAEVELRVHQRNALQHEIYGMKEELKSLNMKQQVFPVQAESLGIGSDFLSDMNMELDAARDKVKALEESRKLLQDENSALISNKAILVSELQTVSDNMDKLSEEKSCLEKSLNDAYSELDEWREKARCLEDSCCLLEKRSCSRDGETDHLTDKVVTLDVQNKELKSQIVEYAKAINSLKDFVTALENRAMVDASSHQGDNKEAKVARRDMALAVCSDIRLEMIEEPRSMLVGEYVDLNDLQRRTKTVEKLITEREKHLLLENSAMKSKFEAAMKQLEDLKPKSNLRRLHTAKVKHINVRSENEDLKPQTACEISEEGSEMTTKDIMLDESSECSSIGFSRTSTLETNDPLEFWEAAFHEGSIDLTVEKTPKMQRSRSEKKSREQHQRRRTHSFVDKEVSVDNLEVPRRAPVPCNDANERKVFERLDSDAQKLTNLHITVQDLKKTVEVTEKTRRGTATGIEYGNVKEQLEESEEAIIKLFNLNLRLKRNLEDESFSLEETSALAFEEKKSIRRRKVTEQARRMSDKIGRLQLEVQKLQFLLMKLEDESKPRQKIKIAERKTRVLLRDYLYTSGTRTTRQRPKRGNFCACAQPSTKGD